MATRAIATTRPPYQYSYQDYYEHSSLNSKPIIVGRWLSARPTLALDWVFLLVRLPESFPLQDRGPARRNHSSLVFRSPFGKRAKQTTQRAHQTQTRCKYCDL